MPAPGAFDTAPTTLTFVNPAQRGANAKLVVSRGRDSISVWLYVGDHCAAFATATVYLSCRISGDYAGDGVLWVGGAAFRLTQDEALAVREQLGVRDEIEDRALRVKEAA